MNKHLSPPPVLSISGLEVRRGRQRILKSVDWTILPGEHWVILGANGSGKTSLLSALTGYLTATAGNISVLGEHYGQTDWRELRKRIGLVSSSIAQLMHPEEPAWLTVASGKEALIDMWRTPSSADRRRALRLLRQIGCAPLAERPWAFLSQGERQRVLIARALMADPEILILDEPCAGLDPAAREHFLQFLGRLGRRARPALVLVTHHVEEVMPVFSHLLLLRKGDVLAAGPKKRMLTAAWLEEVFGAPLKLRRVSPGRMTVGISPARSRIL